MQNWQEIITQMQDVATKETRLGIPIIYGIDTIHGANYVLGATIFPQNIAMAATGNVALMEKIGEITALETRAAGIPWNFDPVLDLARQPMWPRVFETFGEDPYIASTMGAAYIQGQQGDDISSPVKVAVCMKHYLGYSLPGRATTARRPRSRTGSCGNGSSSRLPRRSRRAPSPAWPTPPRSTASRSIRASST